MLNLKFVSLPPHINSILPESDIKYTRKSGMFSLFLLKLLTTYNFNNIQYKHL